MRPILATLCTLAASLLLSSCVDGRPPTGVLASARSDKSGRDLSGAAFTTLLYPGAAGTFATDINDRGEIVGRYMSAGHTHGFLRDTLGNFATIDYPGSNFTVVGAITDSGTMVGWYTVAAAPAVRHGFLLRDGTFSTFDPPRSTYTSALGINNRGDIAGRYCVLAVCHPSSSDFRGFLLRDGEYTNIDVPTGTGASGFKLQPDGTIVGGFAAADGLEELFLYSRGEFTTFALSNGKTVARDNGGINARGDIVGTFCDGAPPCTNVLVNSHGFLLSGGELDTIDAPGATGTNATGINARGDIVGAWFTAAGQSRGFLLTTHGRAP